MRAKANAIGCAACGMNRRQFLGCGACALAAGWLGWTPSIGRAAEAGKTRIRIVYSLHATTQPGPDWPNVGFEFGPVMKDITRELTQRFSDYEFLVDTATGEDQAKKILAADEATPIDGYLVYQLNCWNRVVQTLAKSGKPVLYADFQYGGSGGFLTYMAAFLRQRAPNVGFVSSSKIDDLARAVKCFALVKQGGTPADFVAATVRARLESTPKPSDLSCKPDALQCLKTDECVSRLKASRILAVRSQEAGQEDPILGIPIDRVPFAELNEAWKQADPEQSKAVADKWQQNAAQIAGVSRETLLQSAAMYLGMKAVLKKCGANAITVNCLGGFYGGHIHAYPCLGFHELLNEGLVGACECDTRSTATMVAMTTLSQGRPGYISDPVIDTAKRQIIYAHCVASNRAFGPKGPTNPYQILTHSEDRQGASVRSLLPVGYLTTTLETLPDKKELLCHRGKAMANDPDDRACRTKLAVEPLGDLEKLFTQWDVWGWHRVTYYGDLREPAAALADALGWKLVDEA